MWSKEINTEMVQALNLAYKYLKGTDIKYSKTLS